MCQWLNNTSHQHDIQPYEESLCTTGAKLEFPKWKFVIITLGYYVQDDTILITFSTRTVTFINSSNTNEPVTVEFCPVVIHSSNGQYKDLNAKKIVLPKKTKHPFLPQLSTIVHSDRVPSNIHYHNVVIMFTYRKELSANLFHKARYTSLIKKLAQIERKWDHY